MNTANQDVETCSDCSHAKPPALSSSKWARIGFLWVATTVVYNVFEALLATTFGVKADSVALFGFGLDSVIECAAAAVMLWRLSGEVQGLGSTIIENRERLVRRFVGGTFVALALLITVQGSLSLWHRELPQATIPGVIIAAASLVIMPLVSWGKLRAARELGSAALRAEAKETLVCSYLSLVLLLGLVANAKLGWWWADPVAAFLMVPWLVTEGLEGLRGDACHDG